MRVALFDSNGAKLDSRLGECPVTSEHVVLLDQSTKDFLFNGRFVGPARLAQPWLCRAGAPD